MRQEVPQGNESPRHVLEEILANKKKENALRYPEEPSSFMEMFKDIEWPIVIAEIKLKSPSAGKLTDEDPIDLVKKFQQGGAGAISVLTDKKYFGGSPELFYKIRKATRLPMLWKDFVISADQLVDAQQRGADAVLLIVTALRRQNVDLKAMINFSKALNLVPVVEVYDGQDMAQALIAGADIIGVNSRNLDNLRENLPRALEVLRHIPSSRIALLFSSIKSREDVEKARQAGAKGVLVGTSILKAPDPIEKLRELTSS